MQKIPTKLSDVYIILPDVFGDERGYFLENYNKRKYHSLGIYTNFVQDNESYSTYGVMRGLHYQKGIHAQAKLVHVTQGNVLDVVVDLRAGSPTFGEYISVELTEQNHNQLFIPKGFAHGFIVLSDTARFSYKCDEYYEKESEGSINCLDQDLKIDWRISINCQIRSTKDKKAQSFKDYCKSPEFHYCV